MNEALRDAHLQVESISEMSASDAWSSFKATFMSLVNVFVPRRPVPVRKPQPPWFTADELHCVRKRDNA